MSTKCIYKKCALNHALTNKRIALEMIERAQITPLERKELVTLLEYIFYLTSDKVTRTDFTVAANMASKAFMPTKRVSKLDTKVELGNFARTIAEYYSKTEHKRGK